MCAQKSDLHTISIKVANKPGVLVRCAQVFAKRGFNIDALVVSPSVNPKYSRMTITAQGDANTLEQIIKQTDKLIDVLHVGEHIGQDAIGREYALVKVKVTKTNRGKIVKLIRGRAHIMDESDGAMIIGQAGATAELDDLESKLKKYGVVEIVRSGRLVMAKGQEPT